MFKRLSSSKRKKSQRSTDVDTAREDLPQVWLAVQAGQELEAIGSQADILLEDSTAAPKPKKKVMIKEKKVEQTRKSSDSSDVLIPQEVEAIGWDDQEELDYSKIQQQPSSSLRSGLPVLSMMDQPSVEMGDITRQRRPSGMSSSAGSIFSYAQSTSFQVQSLGKISAVSCDWVDESSPESIVKVVEMAQRHGDIPWTTDPTPSDGNRMLIISKYGVKVTDDRTKRVFCRFALHNIVNVIHYTSIYQTTIVVIRTINEGHRNTNQECDLHLYECQDNDQGSDICVTLGQAFDSVVNKMKMDENLHGPLV